MALITAAQLATDGIYTDAAFDVLPDATRAVYITVSGRLDYVHPESTTTAAPDPILTIMAPIATATAVDLTWTAPEANGLTITDYQVQYKLSSSSSWTNFGSVGNTASATVTGLTSESSYDFRARAVAGSAEAAYGALVTKETTV